MKLYGSLASPYVARVVLAARYKGLDLPVEMPAGGIKSPAYLAMNPFGKMPTLEHDGEHLIESQVICEYLEDIQPQPALMPSSALGRARVRTIARVVDVYIAPEGGALFRQLAPATRDAALVAASKAKLEQAFVNLDSLMADGPWSAGAFSLGDCALLPYVVLMHKTVVPALGVADPVRTLPNLGAWWRQVGADPLTAAFVTELGAAVDAFLARLRGG